MSWVFYNNNRFYLHDNETLLTGLIRTDNRPTFECCQGYCGACKLKVAVINGSIQHTLPPLCHLDDDEVLACCCVVSGAVLVKKPSG